MWRGEVGGGGGGGGGGDIYVWRREAEKWRMVGVKADGGLRVYVCMCVRVEYGNTCLIIFVSLCSVEQSPKNIILVLQYSPYEVILEQMFKKIDVLI